jgi:hypothetical protein
MSERRVLFAVIRAHGPSWDDTRPLEEQALWDEHAQFMDELVERGFVVLGGPLGDDKAMVVCEAPDEETIRTTLAGDPWGEDVLETVSIERWTIRLDAGKRKS